MIDKIKHFFTTLFGKLKQSFCALKNDKLSFLLVLVRISAALLFFIALLFRFIAGNMLINNGTPLIIFPGAGFFVFVHIATLLAFCFLVLLEKGKWLKRVTWVQVVFATVFFFWGITIYRVGVPTARIGFGFILALLSLVLLWIMLLKECIIANVLTKFFIKKEEKAVGEVKVVE